MEDGRVAEGAIATALLPCRSEGKDCRYHCICIVQKWLLRFTESMHTPSTYCIQISYYTTCVWILL